MNNVPTHWYVYDMEEYTKERPTSANYSPENVAPLLEGFASFIGNGTSEAQFVYANGETVSHPGGTHLVAPCSMEKSPELIRYETAAQKSVLLKLFQDNSPAGIEYFDDLC